MYAQAHAGKCFKHVSLSHVFIYNWFRDSYNARYVTLVLKMVRK